MWKVVKGFKGSPDGINVIEFKEGDDFEHDGDLLSVAKKEGWIREQKKTETGKAKTQEELIAGAKKKVDGLKAALDKTPAAKKSAAQEKLTAAEAELAKLLGE